MLSEPRSTGVDWGDSGLPEPMRRSREAAEDSAARRVGKTGGREASDPSSGTMRPRIAFRGIEEVGLGIPPRNSAG